MVFAELSKVKVGDRYPVRIMGAINVSPESFYKGSVRTTPDGVGRLAKRMVDEGAEIIDVGAMSSAPYLKTMISLEVEIKRLRTAIKAIRRSVDEPISVDTPRTSAAKAALDDGATIVNDVSGLKYDTEMAALIAEHNVSSILMANETTRKIGDPMHRVNEAMRETLELAAKAGISERLIVLDPGIGFFRKEGRSFGLSLSGDIPWYVWDCTIIRELHRLHDLGRPVCVSLSRKSFIGKILRLKEPEDRLIGSLSAAAIASFIGAHVIRTHDVRETLQAVRIAENIRDLKLDSKSREA